MDQYPGTLNSERRDLALLIVNWNVRELLHTCLTSVCNDLAGSGLDGEVWVVDNASRDGSCEMVRAEFPQVRLIASPENVGFAGGNNLALRQMGAAAPPNNVMLLNPDTKLQRGALRTLFDFLVEHRGVGVVGARLFYADGGFQHSAFGFPGLWQILFDLFPLPSRLYDTRLNGRYPRAWYERQEPFPVDHPLGAAMMIRWEVIAQVGPFDEGFHMYCEEIDWCARIKQAGWKIYCVPRARVMHYEGQSTRQIRQESFVNLWHSRRRLYDKHYGPAKNWLARHLVRAGMRYRTQATRREEKRGELTAGEALSRIQAYSGALAWFD
jgi:N-acetylglucosaminyl-diphospho-decaprenol L-rhamnosyltransferase